MKSLNSPFQNSRHFLDRFSGYWEIGTWKWLQIRVFKILRIGADHQPEEAGDITSNWDVKSIQGYQLVNFDFFASSGSLPPCKSQTA